MDMRKLVGRNMQKGITQEQLLSFPASVSNI